MIWNFRWSTKHIHFLWCFGNFITNLKSMKLLWSQIFSIAVLSSWQKIRLFVKFHQTPCTLLENSTIQSDWFMDQSESKNSFRYEHWCQQIFFHPFYGLILKSYFFCIFFLNLEWEREMEKREWLLLILNQLCRSFINIASTMDTQWVLLIYYLN